MTTLAPRTHIIGAGLIGASIGIGLRGHGWNVSLEDADPAAQQLAFDIGAGVALGSEAVELVIVAAPPGVAGDLVIAALERFADAVVTDVASVKAPIAALVSTTPHAERYVGSHPMAGRETSGALWAQGDLFRARPWVLCQGKASAKAVELVTAVATALEADVVLMDAVAHDKAVARVSHAPQAAASAVAAALGPLSEFDVALAGQGLRDVTRIAASQPGMWADIATLNSAALRETVDHIITELTALRDAQDIGQAMTVLLDKGRAEVARIPGKHGGAKRDWKPVTVIVPDEPGHLVRLLQDVAQVKVNVEDITIEHSPRQPVGLTTLWVDPARAGELGQALEEGGWAVAGS